MKDDFIRLSQAWPVLSIIANERQWKNCHFWYYEGVLNAATDDVSSNQYNKASCLSGGTLTEKIKTQLEPELKWMCQGKSVIRFL